MAKTTTRSKLATAKKTSATGLATPDGAADIRMIPLDQLEPSPLNVRKVAASASDDGATQMLGGGEAAAESECAPSFPLRSHAATRVRSVERLPAERDENLYRDRSAREGVKHS